MLNINTPQIRRHSMAGKWPEHHTQALIQAIKAQHPQRPGDETWTIRNWKDVMTRMEKTPGLEGVFLTTDRISSKFKRMKDDEYEFFCQVINVSSLGWNSETRRFEGSESAWNTYIGQNLSRRNKINEFRLEPYIYYDDMKSLCSPRLSINRNQDKPIDAWFKKPSGPSLAIQAKLNYMLREDDDSEPEEPGDEDDTETLSPSFAAPPQPNSGDNRKQSKKASWRYEDQPSNRSRSLRLGPGNLGMENEVQHIKTDTRPAAASTPNAHKAEQTFGTPTDLIVETALSELRKTDKSFLSTKDYITITRILGNPSYRSYARVYLAFKGEARLEYVRELLTVGIKDLERDQPSPEQVNKQRAQGRGS